MKRRPLRIAIAAGAFKGTLSADAACRCLERGLRRALPRARFVRLPMADGGDGTVEALAAATGGRLVRRRVSDPLGRPVLAALGLTGDGRTAVLEMAQASGLVRLRPAERDPRITTTRGTGELVRAALDLGAERIVIGLGGSATNDGGAGLARALGARFLDARGRELPEGGAALARLARLDLAALDPRLRRTRFDAACDVDSPLVGPRGAARVYGPQKGATPAMAAELDRALRRFAAVVRRQLGLDVARVPGAGAAGGLGAGLLAFLGARLRPGVEIVKDAVGFEERLRGCDLVITGEGRLDGQTARGKTPAGVARSARRLGLPVVAICGSVGEGAAAVHRAGIAAFFAALREPVPESDLRRRAPGLLADCAEQVGRLLAAGARGRLPSGRPGGAATACRSSSGRARRSSRR